MTPSLFARISLDTSVKPTTVRVYALLTSMLDEDPYKTLKHGYVARLLGWQRPNVSREMRRLIRWGYIEEGPRDGRYRTYRLGQGPP